MWPESTEHWYYELEGVSVGLQFNAERGHSFGHFGSGTNRANNLTLLFFSERHAAFEESSVQKCDQFVDALQDAWG